MADTRQNPAGSFVSAPPGSPAFARESQSDPWLIEARHICLSYGGAEVLHDVSLAIAPGEIVTIVGPNGSGKSTLLRALLGILTPHSGGVRHRPGLRIGYVPQKLMIDPSMPLSLRRFLSLPKRVSDRAAEAALARVGLEGRGALQMAGLSGGQMQRALLARALLVEPQLLMLDEPTQGLDQPGEAAFYRLIEEVRAETGAAVLMVSHDLHVVMAASDRVICLNGHICCEGAPGVVSTAPEYRALFGSGSRGALALYRHDHDHDHSEPHDLHPHDHSPGCGHGCSHDHHRGQHDHQHHHHHEQHNADKAMSSALSPSGDPAGSGFMETGAERGEAAHAR